MTGVALSVALTLTAAAVDSPPAARTCQTPTYLLGPGSGHYLASHQTYRCGP